MHLLPRRPFKPGVPSPNSPNHRKKVEENPSRQVRLGLKFRKNILTLFACCSVKFLAEIQAYVIILARVFKLNSCNRVLSWSVIKDDKEESKSQYIYNKHNTAWKVLCTVVTHSLFLYQKSNE